MILASMFDDMSIESKDMCLLHHICFGFRYTPNQLEENFDREFLEIILQNCSLATTHL